MTPTPVFNMKKELWPESGTYILVLKVKSSQKIVIGKIGQYTFEKGYYIYIGSAHGPGGIKARIERHLKKNKIKHWHIDYLRNIAPVVGILVNYSKKKKECSWASKLFSSTDLSAPIPGFGSSDCACPSHLFFSRVKLDVDFLNKILKQPVEYFKLL